MSFSDFKGNHKQISELKTIIGSDENGIVLVSGDSSTGKTKLYHILKNENKYDILYVDDSNYNDVMLQNFIESKTIENFFKKVKKIVFIDDVDTIAIGKQTLGNLTKYKDMVLFIMTIKQREERKFKNLCKKIITHTIVLNKLNYKECFQVVLDMLSDREDIDTTKLLDLVKKQDGNISNVLMQIESATNKWDQVNGFDNSVDMFHDNIYSTVSDIYNTKLSTEYIASLCSKDSSILTSIIHENILNIKANVDDYIEFYSIFGSCDIIDKHIYVSCSWGLNWNMMNMYRFTYLNSAIQRHAATTKPFTINFTQQFTKLSSQVGMKKKVMLMPKPFQYNLIDVLHYSSTVIRDVNDKAVKDLVTKFVKDFDVLETDMNDANNDTKSKAKKCPKSSAKSSTKQPK